MRPPLNPARAARRKVELEERLGSERPVCTYCGYAEPEGLRRITPKIRRLLQKHHPLGRNHAPDLTAHACLNCHALAHEKLLDAGVDLEREADPYKRVATMLRAEAVHLEMLADTKRQQAALLEGEMQ